METLLKTIEQENESMSLSKNLTALQQDAVDLTKSFDDDEIQEILKRDFDSSFMSTMDIRMQKERRKGEESKLGDELGGTGKRRIATGVQDDIPYGDGAAIGPSINENKSLEPQIPIVPVPILTYQQRFDNFKKIIDDDCNHKQSKLLYCYSVKLNCSF
jgi:hypothetical protein